MYLLKMLIIGVVLGSNFTNAQNASWSFTIPSGEQTVIQGNMNSELALNCNLNTGNLKEDDMLNFIAIDKPAVVNGVPVIEGSIMVMPILHSTNGFKLKLKPKASLGIINNSTQDLNFSCR